MNVTFARRLHGAQTLSTSDPGAGQIDGWASPDAPAKNCLVGWVKLARPPSAGQPIRLSKGGTSSLLPALKKKRVPASGMAFS